MPTSPSGTPQRAVAPTAAEQPPEQGGARIGRSITIHGDVSGDEDIIIEGNIHGCIELAEHHLTIGPSGVVRGRLNARTVHVIGRVEGAITALARVEVSESGIVEGDITTYGLVISDGAAFNGRVMMVARPAARPSGPAADVDAYDGEIESLDLLVDEAEVQAMAVAAQEARVSAATPLPRVARALTPMSTLRVKGPEES